ncbi:MAG: MarR family transcriptional regulator [Desulfuromonadaceae bacterium]|nr:MarR family transcriptional regulator [Desulfuromonadaceae bacterium]
MKLKSVVVAEVIDDIRRIFQVLTEQSRKIEHETSLTGPQLWVVKILKEASPMKVSELARRMYLHPATMVGLLDRLEAKGVLTRTRSEKDRRVVYIDLTMQGHELEINSPEVVQNLLVSGLEKLTTNELKTISGGLGQIVSILGVKGAPPQLIMSSEINAPKRRRKTNN